MAPGYPALLYVAILLVLAWTRLTLPLDMPLHGLIMTLAKRVIQGDLPEELASFEIYAPEKPRMVQDLLELGAHWQRDYRRLRLTSAFAGTCALAIATAMLFLRLAGAGPPVMVLLGTAGVVTLLVSPVIEERMKRSLREGVPRDIGGIVELWRKRFAGEAGGL